MAVRDRGGRSGCWGRPRLSCARAAVEDADSAESLLRAEALAMPFSDEATAARVVVLFA